MMSLSKDLLFLLLQFCHEEDLKKTAHMLEQETGIFFDMKYFEDLVISGNWNEAENYLSGFIGVDDSKYSIKIYFEIRKQKFLEALDKHDRPTALEILVKDLKVFAPTNEELYKEMSYLLTLDDLRKHSALFLYGDVTSARKSTMNELKSIIEASPQFHGKLKCPEIIKARLRRLVNQSLNWQHIRCSNPQDEPVIKSLFIDHECPPPDNLHTEMNVQRNLLTSKSMMGRISTLSGEHPSNLASETQSVITDEAVNLGFHLAPKDSQDDDSLCMRRSRATWTQDEEESPLVGPYQINSSEWNVLDNLPRTVGCIVNLASSPTSMDFHPLQQNILLVGNSVGYTELWEIFAQQKLFTIKLEDDLVNNTHISVNRTLWNPDGSMFGVAYSEHFVQLYSYNSDSSIQKHLEINAHVGSVNDIAFSKPAEQLFLISCGDDKLIQVWDVSTGVKQYTFEGHTAPVYSVCPHLKEHIHFIFSTSTNGEIKAWLYDNMGSRIAYDSPDNCCMKMIYSTDGKRLFSCGTNKNRESCLVEWDETEGFVIKTYKGLSKFCSGVLQFDTSKNRVLAAADDHLVKVWDMDNVEMLTVIDAGGGLPASPLVCFNKTGTILAVSANNNTIKILGNDNSLQLLRTSKWQPFDTAEILKESLKMNGDGGNLKDMGSELTKEPDDAIEVLKLSKIDEPTKCQSLRLLSEMSTSKISRLIYTNSGNAILALAANGIHLIWKWPENETNLIRKATTKIAPQLWQPVNGLLMNNDISGINFKKVFPCFALSRNDGYIVSSSGGMISLFNAVACKTMKSFMPPPPTVTSIAFYPQDNNILAIGTDDSTILIYNVRTDEVKRTLKDHFQRVTGLAFSNVLDILISSGADAQIILWDSKGWKNKKSKMLQVPIGRMPLESSDTHVQFHKDQMHFLAVHESHLALYEITQLECVNQWLIGEFYAPISQATLSSDSQSIYTCLLDGTVLILDVSKFQLQCEINSTAYLPSQSSLGTYPLVIATNPQEPNQFALGLTNGDVIILEPLDSEGRWHARPSCSRSSPGGNASLITK